MKSIVLLICLFVSTLIGISAVTSLTPAIITNDDHTAHESTYILHRTENSSINLAHSSQTPSTPLSYDKPPSSAPSSHHLLEINHLVISALPTGKNLKRTVIRGFIDCLAENSSNICTQQNLTLTPTWQSNYRPTFWLQTYVRSDSSGDIVAEVIDNYNLDKNPVPSQRSVPLFSKYDPTIPEHFAKLSNFTKVYFVGEFHWDSSFTEESTILDIYLSTQSRQFGHASVQVQLFKMNLDNYIHHYQQDSIGGYRYISEPPPFHDSPYDTAFTYYLNNIPFQFSTVYIQHFAGTIFDPLDGPLPDDGSGGDDDGPLPPEDGNVTRIQPICYINGVPAKLIPSYVTTQRDSLELIHVGYFLMGYSEGSDLPVRFPAKSDLTIDCVSIRYVLSGKETAEEVTLTVGVNIQVLPFGHPLVDTPDPTIHRGFSLDQRLIFTEILNPPYTEPDEVDSRFTFFHLEPQNIPKFHITPYSPLKWVGNTIQPFTNDKLCISVYNRVFSIHPNNPGLTPDQFIFRTSLEHLGRPKLLWSHWTIHDHVGEHLYGGHLHPDNGKYDLENNIPDPTSRLRFDPIVIPPKIIDQIKSQESYFNVSFALQCPHTSISQTASSSSSQHVVSTPSIGTFLLEHTEPLLSSTKRKRMFRNLHAAVLTPYSQVHDVSTGVTMQALAYRVNLNNTLYSKYRAHDIKTNMYRYRFKITYHNFPMTFQSWPEEKNFYPPGNYTNDDDILPDGNDIIPNHSIDYLYNSNKIYTEDKNYNYEQPQLMHDSSDYITIEPSQLSDDILRSPAQWLNLTIPGEVMAFHGEFRDCSINGHAVIPYYVVNSSYITPVEPQSFQTVLSFLYSFTDATSNSSSTSSRQQRNGQIILQCNDVFLVNTTVLELLPFDFHHHRHFHQNDYPNDPQLPNSPAMIPLLSTFSHYIVPQNLSNWKLTATMLEFDPIRIDYFRGPAQITSIIILVICALLSLLWCYSGSESAILASIHRTNRKAKTRAKLVPLSLPGSGNSSNNSSNNGNTKNGSGNKTLKIDSTSQGIKTSNPFIQSTQSSLNVRRTFNNSTNEGDYVQLF